MRSLRGKMSVAGGDDSGVTVLELVVASAILLVCAVSVIGALTFAGTASAQTSVRARGLNLANQLIEQARNLPYDSVGTVYANGVPGNPRGSIPVTATVGPFFVTTDIRWATDPSTGRSQYKTMKVTVSWQRPRPGSVTVSSAIYGKSYLINTGDLEVRVRDMETGAEIPGAEVVVMNGTMRTLAVTPASGNAFFGEMPSGLASVTVNASGYIFDPSQLASVTITPDYLTSVVARGQRPSSATFQVVDSAGKKVASAWVLLTPTTGLARQHVGGDGVVVFSDLLIGKYSVVAGGPNRSPALSSIEVTQGNQSLVITITLGEKELPGTLTVRTSDPNGIPLDGVNVTLLGPAPTLVPVGGSPQTTANGLAVFGKLGLGDYRVSTSLSGYASVTATASVPGDQAYSIWLTLVPTGGGRTTGSLRVIVVKGDVVQPGVLVTVTYPNGRSIFGTTNSRGELALGNLLPGDYWVTPTSGVPSSHTVYEGKETVARVEGW